MYNMNRGIKRSMLEVAHSDEYDVFLAQTAVPMYGAPIVGKEPLMFREKGVPITPIYTNTNIITEALKTRGAMGTEIQPSNSNGDTFFTQVTQNIMTIDGEYTIAEALRLVQKFIVKAKNNFYGVLLRSTTKGSIILNPLHPLVATALISTQNFKTMKFKILLYFYPNRVDMDVLYKSYNTTVETVQSSVTNLLRLSKRNTEVKIDIGEVLNVEKDDNMLDVRIIRGQSSRVNHVGRHHPEMTNAPYYTLPHQLLTRGNIAPYYGTSILRLAAGHTGECCPVSPFLAANVSNSSAVTPNQIRFNNVCTGSQSKKTLEGLSSLNHAYLGSPLNKTLIRPGALMYADQCIDTSMFLYHKAGIVEEHTPITKPPIPEVTFPDEHTHTVKSHLSIFSAVKEIRESTNQTLVEATKYVLTIRKYLSKQPVITDVFTYTQTESGEPFHVRIDVPPLVTVELFRNMLETQRKDTTLVWVNPSGHIEVHPTLGREETIPMNTLLSTDIMERTQTQYIAFRMKELGVDLTAYIKERENGSTEQQN